MRISDRNIWQIAAGDETHSYHQLFFDWDVIAIGPGAYGKWPECEEELLAGRGPNQVTIVRRFVEGIQEGDIIVLRRGKTTLYGIGEVVGPYVWLDDFGDVDGWDLQHVRRVRWLWKAETSEGNRFDEGVLRWGASVQKASSPVLNEFLDGLNLRSSSRKLVSLPPSCVDGMKIAPVEIEEVISSLFDLGVDLRNVGQIVDQLRELETLAKWYYRSAHKPKEHETLAYLVIPLLRSLGWTPQRLAIEWNYIDIAGFGILPRKDANLRLAVEAKAMDSACLMARDQGERYVTSAERSGCNRLVLTEGTRYGIFFRGKGGKFPNHADAYLNLIRRLPDYPITKSQGAIKAFEALAADWGRE